jgi:hypothetical protein
LGCDDADVAVPTVAPYSQEPCKGRKMKRRHKSKNPSSLVSFILEATDSYLSNLRPHYCDTEHGLVTSVYNDNAE